MEMKLAAAKSEMVATSAECADLYARLHESDTKVQSAKAAAEYAADRDVNMQQQITALKHKVAASSHDHESLQLQHQLEQAHQQIADLQHQSRTDANRALQTESLKNRLSNSEKQFQQQLIQTEELQSILTQMQAEKQKLKGEITVWAGQEQKHQMQVTALNQQLSGQQEQLSLASERFAQANAQLGEEQQAAIELQQDLHNIKQQAAATDASTQHIQQQLEQTKQQLQEKEQTLTNMADQLDALTSAVAAKEGSIQLLRQQVQQMDLLATHTHAAKHEAQQMEAQLRTATEQLSKRSQDISIFKGKMEGLQTQQAQLAILEAALTSSKNDKQQSLDKVALLEEQLAYKQDDLHAQKAQLGQQQTQVGSMQAAMATMQRQLEAASASHESTQQQLHSSQAEIVDCKQLLADAQALLTSNEANLQSSNQSIAALQEGISQQMAVVTASEGKYQALLAEIDAKDEQLKQMAGKLHAGEHAAVSAQDAVRRLQTRLTGQQAEANDQSQELNDALEVGSNTVHQLEVTIQVLQEKLFAAENAMESQREQLHNQKASACDSIKHAEQLAQQLTDKTSLITSLQAALDTATFVADLNQHLVNSLQETHSSREADAGEHLVNSLQETHSSREADAGEHLVNSLQETHSSREADAGEQVKSLVAQLQLQASKNSELLAELASVKGKLSLANQAIAAADNRTQASQQQQAQLGAKVMHLTQLLESRERREWLAKTHAADIEVSLNPCVSAAARPGVQGVVSSPPSSLQSPELAHKLTLLTLAPKSAGSLRTRITSVAGQRPTSTPLSEIVNMRKASSKNKGAVLQTSTSVYDDGADAKENNSVLQMS
ncbi:TPA: hypothetical protein ACH3X1_012545 [Trebouxia sp. C0004]